ncbi:MAG: SusD/RagB family nutrient-binding outer membrane lipoprotein [Flavobacteriaceae bacterium]
MKKFRFLILSFLILTISCEKMVEGINDNPNDISVADVETKLFLTGGQLANIQVQLGHLNRISGMYSGQLIGFSSLYSNIYGFNLSTAEANSTWNAVYVGVITNMRHVVNTATNPLLKGIAKVVEAHAVGTAASLFGDIPYSEAGNPEISDPKFDNQKEVYTSVIALLDEAIGILQSANSASISEDIYFGGNKNKWITAAHTLKARFYLHQKDYSNAFSSAQKGISSPSDDMKYIPRGSSNVAEGDKNLFWMILEGSRAGDIGNSNGNLTSYHLQLLDQANSSSRNHAKTDETARFNYFKINSGGGSLNKGVIEQFESQNMVTYFETQLILAETAGRSGGVTAGLPYLNNVRSWLNSGAGVNDNFLNQSFKYLPFDASDFNSGGIENTDNVDSKTAFLREVIEERYVTGFGTHIPFNDARRLRKTDASFAVPYVLVNGQNPPYPERMPYADNELNSNENAPAEDPGIFLKTVVNQ